MCTSVLLDINAHGPEPGCPADQECFVVGCVAVALNCIKVSLYVKANSVV